MTTKLLLTYLAVVGYTAVCFLVALSPFVDQGMKTALPGHWAALWFVFWVLLPTPWSVAAFRLVDEPPGWISVEKRLPKPNSEVRAWVSGPHIQYQTDARYKWDASLGSVRADWVSAWDHTPLEDPVTHWMPLPDSPVEE